MSLDNSFRTVVVVCVRSFLIVLDIKFVTRIGNNRVDIVYASAGGCDFNQLGPYRGLRVGNLSIQPRYLSDLPEVCVRRLSKLQRCHTHEIVHRFTMPNLHSKRVSLDNLHH